MAHIKVTIFWLFVLTILVLLWQYVSIPRPKLIWPTP
jgi:hypothetical protein